MIDYQKIIQQLDQLETEQINKKTINIDQMMPLEIVAAINREDATVAGVVRDALPEIAKTSQLFADCFGKGGRIFYLGAGTSGRLGVLDAAEAPPTFGTDPKKIIGLIAGGYDTLVMSREGVEDREEDAVKDIEKHNVCEHDLVIGIAASRRTPYTIAGLKIAQKMKARTVFIICNKPDASFLSDEVIENLDVLISLPVGPEVITGSTRMKSATAQKLTLNMISTAAMVLLGKTLGNLMVDLQARSDKLAARSRKILIDLLEISLDESDDLLVRASGSVKTAIVMHRFSCNAQDARDKLDIANGFISRTK